MLSSDSAQFKFTSCLIADEKGVIWTTQEIACPKPVYLKLALAVQMMWVEEVGTGHVSSKNADVAPLTLYCFFFLQWRVLDHFSRRVERSSE